jgi:hypothetical protein
MTQQSLQESFVEGIGMSDTENRLTPRQVAVAMISEQRKVLDGRIRAQQRFQRDAGSLFHSQTYVFLQQVGVELDRAARHIEFVDMADEPNV